MGVFTLSTGAIFIRLAQGEGTPSLYVAFGRLGFSILFLSPIVLSKYRAAIYKISKTQFLLIGLAGLFLALHFVSWIISLEYTSVLISVVFVTTSPLWVAVLEVVILKVRMPKVVIVGLIVAMLGGLIIGLGNNTSDVTQTGQNHLLGAILSLIGAFAIAIYLIVGRTIRKQIPLLPYIWLVYGSASIFLLAILLISQTSLSGYSELTYVYLVALALLPQLIGHTAINNALAHLPATIVGMSTQLEPVGSAIIALFLFSEIPTFIQIIGSTCILIGVILANRSIK